MFISLPSVRYSLPLGIYLCGTVGTICALLLRRYYTVEIGPEGISLYGIWWIPWGDVTEVQYVLRLFLMPYFCVKGCYPFPCWIPLYFVGKGDLASAIIDAAPYGNPFRSVSMR